MSKVEHLLKSIAALIKSESDDLKAELEAAGLPEPDKLVGYIDDFETKIAKLLKQQRVYFTDALKSHVSKADDDAMTVAGFYNYNMQDLFAADDFAEQIGKEASAFLYMTVPELAGAIMEAIDPDVPFVEMSKRATAWIDEWAPELGKLMQLTSHDAVEREFKQAIEKGEGIEKVVLRMKDLPQFDRARARTTAITEILTASSYAQYESYAQSPVVEGMTWRHSGGKKNNPRQAHVDLDGTTIAKDATFEVNGHSAHFPRDTSLPATERINCHCTTTPNVNEKILGLSKEEKEKIRQQALDDLNA